MNDDKKDLINFDKHGRPRTPDEIADILADSVIAFDENGRLRSAKEIEQIKFVRMLQKHPEYIDWIGRHPDEDFKKTVLPQIYTQRVPEPAYS